MSKCEKNGCQKTATDLVRYNNPMEDVEYCRTHAIKEYQTNASSWEMTKKDDTDE